MRITAPMLVLACAMNAVPAQAQEVSALRETAILMTISEATLATFSLVQDHAGGGLDKFSWTARYSEREWVLQATASTGAQDLHVTMTGFLWGEEKSDWIVSYSGLGKLGEEDVQIHGQTVWMFDHKLADYRDMDFRQMTKFGSNSFWGWVVGAEIVVGGTIGATSGMVGGPAGALGGAILIGGAAVSASSGIKNLLKSDDPVPAPPAPARPTPPKEGEKIVPDNNTILVAVSPDGAIQGNGLDGIVLKGSFSSEKGYAEGLVTAK